MGGCLHFVPSIHLAKCKQLRRNSVTKPILLFTLRLLWLHLILKKHHFGKPMPPRAQPVPEYPAFWAQLQSIVLMSVGGTRRKAFSLSGTVFSHKHRHCFNPIKVPILSILFLYFNQMSCKKTGTATVVGSSASSSAPHAQRLKGSRFPLRLIAVAISQLCSRKHLKDPKWLTEKTSRILPRL